MAIIVTENWSAEALSYRSPYTAVREFVVTGTTNAQEAINAPGIPQRNATHPYNLALRCLGPAVRQHRGLEYWVIECPYSVPEGGSTHETEPDDPLNKPARISWQNIEVTEAVDRDLDGRPILYTNGAPVDPPLSRPTRFKQLRVVRNEPTWDINKSLGFENATNANPVTIGGTITVAAQHMRCVSIQPAGEYEQGSTYLAMEYLFEIIFDDSLGSKPFQHRIMDQGDDGWYDDDGTIRRGKFSDGRGEPITGVRLDGSGKPHAGSFSHVRVGPDDAAPVSPPQAVDVMEKEVTSGAVFLYYKKTRVVDFAGIFG